MDHAGQRVGADVEALVPLQDHRQRAVHALRRDILAIGLQRAGAGTADAAEVVECQRSVTEAIVPEIELDVCRPGGKASGASRFRRSRSPPRSTGTPAWPSSRRSDAAS